MDIKEIITDYLKRKDTDYAIMVDGQWGSGKTHFWKNEVVELISKSELPEPSKKEKKGNKFWKKDVESVKVYFKPIYISLFGVSSKDDLDKKIFIELNPFWKKKGMKVISNLGKLVINKGVGIFGIDEFKKSDFDGIVGELDISRDKVMCFDDLERLKPEILDEVFGLINLFVEHDHIKVIIICDEKKIRNKVNNYIRIKEKLIRFTYNYDPDLFQIFPNFATKYTARYSGFLLEQKEFICNLYLKAGHKNLRTLKFNLDLLESIFHYTSKTVADKDDKNSVLNQIVLFVSTYCIEYKDNQNSKRLNTLSEITSDNSQYFAHISLDKLLDNKDDDTTSLTKAKVSYTEKFREKYLPYENTKFDYFPSIANYIHTGSLDFELLSSEINDILGRYNVRKSTREEELLQKINNIYELEDNELKPLIEELLSMVENGKFQLSMYPNLFVSFLKIEFRGLENFKIDSKIIDKFKLGIDKGKEISKPDDSFSWRMPQFQTENLKYNEIKDYAIEANFSLKEQVNNSYLLKIYKSMSNNNQDEIYELITTSEFQFEPIFDLADPKEFFDATLKLTNTCMSVLNDSFHKRYNYHNSSTSQTKEIPFFVGYLELIKLYLKDKGDYKISSDILVALTKTLTSIINKPT
jgi:hypothetical protein